MTLRNQHVEPESIVTDGLESYASALCETRLQDCHRPSKRRKNNCAKAFASRGLKAQAKDAWVKSQNSARRFLETHAAIYNALNVQRHMINRRTLGIFRSRSDSVWTKAVP